MNSAKQNLDNNSGCSGCFTECFFLVFYFVCLFTRFPYGLFVALGVYFLRQYLKQKALEKAEAKEVEKKLQAEAKEVERELQREKRLANLKSELSRLSIDYIEAFIKRVGMSHFTSFDLIAKIPELNGALEIDDINMFLTNVGFHIKDVETAISKSTNIEEAQKKASIKEAFESLLLVTENLPNLKAVLERKGAVLNYSELVDLLKIRHEELCKERITPHKEELYNSVKKATFIFLEKARLEKTKEDIATAFISTITAIKRENSVVIDKALSAVPNLLSDFLNRLLKESKVIQDDLPQDEMEDLLRKKTKEVEIDVFEAELKKGVKPTMVFPSNLNTLSGSDFESFLEKLFRKLGHSVVKTSLTGDQGADLVIEKSGERIAVQAKRYSGVVSNKAVQEVVAAVSYYKCSRAIVVTTSTFTKSALKLAISNKVELWDGRKLKEMMNSLKDSVVTNNSTAESNEIERRW